MAICLARGFLEAELRKRQRLETNAERHGDDAQIYRLQVAVDRARAAVDSHVARCNKCQENEKIP